MSAGVLTSSGVREIRVRAEVVRSMESRSMSELTEVGRLFRVKLGQLREQERRAENAKKSTAAAATKRVTGRFLSRRALLEAVENVPKQDELLRASEVALLLKVTPKKVARWAASDGLPCIRTIGGHRRYYWADVARWLDRETHGQGERRR